MWTDSNHHKRTKQVKTIILRQNTSRWVSRWYRGGSVFFNEQVLQVIVDDTTSPWDSVVRLWSGNCVARWWVYGNGHSNITMVKGLSFHCNEMCAHLIFEDKTNRLIPEMSYSPNILFRYTHNLGRYSSRWNSSSYVWTISYTRAQKYRYGVWWWM